MKRPYIDVAYQDKDVIVVNKPRGVIVIGEKGDKAKTLTDSVKGYLMRKYEGARGAFVRPMHRLDRDTTGLIIFARSNAGLRLVEAMKSHAVKRVYLALVEGRIEDESGEIKLPLVKGDFGFGKKVAVSDDGKPAITQFSVVERYANATLLKVNLKTGFTHQIRVHLASIGHPLIGDKTYNPHSKIRFPRQALHSAECIFKHPVSGKKIQVRAELPRDLEGLVEELRMLDI